MKSAFGPEGKGRAGFTAPVYSVQKMGVAGYALA